MTVAIGITTVDRPEYLEKSSKALVRHCASVVDGIYLYNDGSSPKFHGAYERAYKSLRAAEAVIMECPVNHGVAYAKNQLLGAILDDGSADWILLAEDDIIAKAPEAVTEYVRIAEAANLHHLAWGGHGPANSAGPVRVDGDLAFNFHSVGAWCLYSRESLEDVGLFNEGFTNCWEHVELSLRLAAAGYTTGAYDYADALHANDWLTEISGSIEKSSIRPRPDWFSNIRAGLQFWSENMPETFAMLFGPDMPLHAYAQSIIG